MDRIARRLDPRAPRRRLLRPRLILIVVALLGVIWLAPFLVAKSPLRNLVAARLLGSFDGKVQVGSASTGWLSPIRLSDVEVLDADGQRLGLIKQVKTDRVLLALLVHPDRPGHVVVNDVAVHLVLEEDEFNWERALAPMLADSGNDSSSSDLSIELTDLKLYTSTGDGRPDLIRLESATLDFSDDDATCLVEGELSTPDAGAASFRFALTESTKDGEHQRTLRCDTQCEGLSINAFSVFLARFIDDTEIHGELNGTLRFSIDCDTLDTKCEFTKFRADQFRMTSQPMIGPDQLQIASLELSGALHLKDRFLSARDLHAMSSIGDFAIDGQADFSTLSSLPDSIGQIDDFTFEGNIDLPALLSMLPTTLRIRDDVLITGGRVSWIMFSREEGGDRRVLVDINAENISGRHLDQPFELQHPFRVSTSIRSAGTGSFQLEFLECQSDFLHIDGAGSQNNGTCTGVADLGLLQSQLSQFVDFGETHLHGQIRWNLAWAPPAHSGATSIVEPSTDMGHLVDVGGTIEFDAAQIGFGGQNPIELDKLTIEAQVRLERGELGFSRAVDGFAVLESSGDRVELTLKQPVAVSWDSSFPLDITIQGQAESLVDRVRLLVPENVTSVRGRLVIQGAAEVSRRRMTFRDLFLSCDQFDYSTGSLAIQEDRVEGSLSGIVDWSEGTIELSDSTLRSGSVAMGVDLLELRWGKRSSAVRLQFSYRADSFRLSRWFATESDSFPRPFGEVAGRGEIRWDPDESLLELNGSIEPLALGKRIEQSTSGAATQAQWISIWNEDSVQFGTRMRSTDQFNSLEIADLTITGDSLRLVGTGRVDRPFDDFAFELTGDLETDLETLSVRLHPWTQDMVSLSGRTNEPFSVRGNLVESADTSVGQGSIQPAVYTSESHGMIPFNLHLTCGTRFDASQLMGLRTGPGTMRVELVDQVARFETIETPVDQGRIRATPVIDFSTARPVLILRDERIIQNVFLTSDVTKSWVAYGAPILAGATETEGVFSAYVADADLPLTDIFGGTARGQLDIREARIGPSPVGSQLLFLVQQIRDAVQGRIGGNTGQPRWIQLPQQSIQCQLGNRRIYHDSVVILVDGIPVTTSGSIGADQSLDMTVSFRIPASWVAGRRFASSLANVEIKIPLTGTLSQPRFDSNALQQILGNLLQGATGGAIEDEIRRGLQGLFGDGF